MKKPPYIYHVFVANNEENSVTTAGIFIRKSEAVAFVKKSDAQEPPDDVEHLCIEQIATRKDVLLAEGEQFFDSVRAHLGDEIAGRIYPFKKAGQVDVETRLSEIADCICGTAETDTNFRFRFEHNAAFLRCVARTPLAEFFAFALDGATFRENSVSLKSPGLMTNKFGAWLYAMAILVPEKTFKEEIQYLKAGRCKFDGTAIIKKGILVR